MKVTLAYTAKGMVYYLKCKAVQNCTAQIYSSAQISL